MEIRMIGIDHSKATVAQREQFSLTKYRITEVLQRWKKERAFSGGLILSTCNRTELWVSGKAKTADLREMLLEASQTASGADAGLFVERQGQTAVSHLFRLACGMQSRIYGEDQILSQVRESLELSRMAGCSDKVIEKLLQTAVAAGKKVKEQVRPETASPSAAQNCLTLLRERFGDVKHLSCLVIGNGRMGKLTARMLTEAGAQVDMTLRKQFHGRNRQESIRVDGCRMIAYEERLRCIGTYDAVISATASPHYTIHAKDLDGVSFADCIWIDMAVPRDLEPSIAEVGGIDLYDMDRLGETSRQQDTVRMEQEAAEILQEFQDVLIHWFQFEEYVTTVKEIAKLVSTDTVGRLRGQTDLAAAQYLRHTEEAAKKAVEKVLFGLRDTLPQEYWGNCFAALRKSAVRDTVKTGKPACCCEEKKGIRQEERKGCR